MNKFVKTYGIYGLLEWHGVVKHGTISMKVSFTNGTTTAYGVSPATFTTKDEVTQYVIENSDKFKSGRIKLVSARPLVPTAEEKKAAMSKAPETAETPVSEEGANELTEKEFRIVEDAKDYLSEQFGASRSKMRTKSECEAVAKEHGIKIIWKE